ncbi:MAG: hypothetical protein KJZ65_12940 [Phycisphaerales bacterium]|nr:hypothetical protein [Phycisphaerales bacterium]
MRSSLASILMLMLALGVGCASKPGELFASPGIRPSWPAPPERPRVRYVGELAQDIDLKPGRKPMEGLRRALFGRESPREMVRPLDVCSDGGQRVFVADPGGRAVHVFDLGTRAYGLWAPPKQPIGFRLPVGLAWDPRGRLVVSDSEAKVLFVFDARGTLLGTLGENMLARPCGVAVDAGRDRIYVADAGAHQVVVISADGTEIGRIGRRGTGPGEFNFPTDVVLGPDGSIVVSDSLNFRVQVLDSGGGFVRQIGQKGDMPGYFSQPKGVAIDPEGHLYVVDANFEAVQVFSPDGALLMSFGREGRRAGEFWLPSGISIDASARIWIADSYNKRIQVFEYLPEGVEP